MKKIEEKYIKTEYKVVAYDVYVDNVCKGKKGACSSAYLVLKDGKIVGKSSYFADSIFHLTMYLPPVFNIVENHFPNTRICACQKKHTR